MRSAALCLLVLLAVPGRAAAQVSATLSGLVTNASGGAVAGAAVTAKDVETSAVRKTTTDAGGRYQIPDLVVGGYELTIAKDGFQTVVRGGIELTVGQRARLDVVLPLGAMQTQVTVTGDVSPVAA